MLENLTNIPVAGVIPYLPVDVDDEDSLSERLEQKQGHGICDIAAIRFPRISNFTDLNALERLDGVSVRYITSAKEWGEPDLVVLPGTKNTMGDLKWMRENGLEAKILQYAFSGRPVFGICGGYQMMGQAAQRSGAGRRRRYPAGNGPLPGQDCLWTGKGARTGFGNLRGAGRNILHPERKSVSRI